MTPYSPGLTLVKVWDVLPGLIVAELTRLPAGIASNSIVYPSVFRAGILEGLGLPAHLAVPSPKLMVMLPESLSLLEKGLEHVDSNSITAITRTNTAESEKIVKFLLIIMNGER